MFIFLNLFLKKNPEKSLHFPNQLHVLTKVLERTIKSAASILALKFFRNKIERFSLCGRDNCKGGKNNFRDMWFLKRSYYF